MSRVVVTVTEVPANGGRSAVTTHHLPTAAGAFAFTFTPAQAGIYRCVASTPANLQSAAGTSAVVTLSVS